MTSTSWTTPEKVSLLLNLIGYLRVNGATDVAELAAHFGAPESVIRRLATFLGTAGVPGDSSTYQHQDLYDIDWDALELDDVIDLKHVVGVDATARFTSTQAAALLAGLNSMSTMLNDEAAVVAASAEQKLRAASSNTPATLSIHEDGEPMAERLKLLRASITQRLQSSFSYLDRDGATSERTIDAHHLFQIDEAWCVEGWCHDRLAMRTFRLDSMRNLHMLETPQTHAASDRPRAEQHTTGEGVSVDVLISPNETYRFETWGMRFGETQADGRVAASVTLLHPDRAIALVSVAPGALEVVEPREIRELVVDWADRLRQHHTVTGGQAQYGKDSVH